MASPLHLRSYPASHPPLVAGEFPPTLSDLFIVIDTRSCFTFWGLWTHDPRRVRVDSKSTVRKTLDFRGYFGAKNDPAPMLKKI